MTTDEQILIAEERRRLAGPSFTWPSKPNLSGLYRDRFDVDLVLEVAAIPSTAFCLGCSGRVQIAEYRITRPDGRIVLRCHDCAVRSWVASRCRIA
jgi:hypothetical protein